MLGDGMNVRDFHPGGNGKIIETTYQGQGAKNLKHLDFA